MSTFDPQRDIPDLSGRVCLVTGGNSGLGEATIAAIAQHNPQMIYLAARSRAKAEAALDRIKATSTTARSCRIEILELDLASLESVKAAAARVNNEADRLDILHLNGGVGMIPAATTKDGYEVHFGTNYLGHVLLTQLLLPKLIATTKLPGADGMVVCMSSVAHKVFAPKQGILFDELKSDMSRRGGRTLYGQAMLAKTLFAHELAKRYPHITATSLHPGTVKSNTWSGDKDVNWVLRTLVINPLVAVTGVSNDEGAKTQLWCTFSGNVKNGSYYEPVGKAGKEGKLAVDDKLSAALWEWTNKELQSHGAPGWVPT